MIFICKYFCPLSTISKYIPGAVFIEPNSSTWNIFFQYLFSKNNDVLSLNTSKSSFWDWTKIELLFFSKQVEKSPLLALHKNKSTLSQKFGVIFAT